jgi:hypothetical protein
MLSLLDRTHSSVTSCYFTSCDPHSAELHTRRTLAPEPRLLLESTIRNLCYTKTASLASSHKMSDYPALLDSAEYEEASTEEKIGYCDNWLQNHPNCRDACCGLEGTSRAGRRYFFSLTECCSV